MTDENLVALNFNSIMINNIVPPGAPSGCMAANSGDFTLEDNYCGPALGTGSCDLVLMFTPSERVKVRLCEGKRSERLVLWSGFALNGVNA